jgi:hypothetical protein
LAFQLKIVSERPEPQLLQVLFSTTVTFFFDFALIDAQSMSQLAETFLITSDSKSDAEKWYTS